VDLQLCPKCLLEAGFITQPFEEAQPVIKGGPGKQKGLPQAGEQFGHYQMLHLLGQGGMGVVYEAEDLETGRRIALKLLGQGLDSPEARSRFLREGRLAASINHPNSVYVFGTEEIAGTPVISMELMSRGTLRDRVAVSGPLPAAEAVDAVIQIVMFRDREAVSKGALWALTLTWTYAVCVVIIPCLLAALLFRGGALLQGLGIIIVTTKGKPASRLRVFWRNLVAWLPFVCLGGLASMLGIISGESAQKVLLRTIVVLLGLLSALTLVSLSRPKRGLQDRLSGTFLVPR